MLYYRQKENEYKQEVDDDSKKIMGDAICCVDYCNSYWTGFDKPFMTTTTKGLLAAFFLCATMVAITLSKSSKK